MIRTLDFNGFAAGTVIDDEYAATDGVTVSAVGGSNLAMLFDSNNPTGDDTDLASDTLDGLLIISGDGDSSDPDDFDGGGSIFFDFDTLSTIKSITFKDIEETTGEGTRLIFYDTNGDVIDNQFVEPTEDGGERTVQLFVPGTARLEVRLEGSGAVDNLVFDDGLPADTSPTAVDDTGETTVETPVIVDLLSNDTDPDNTPDELSIAAVSVPPEQGTVVDNGDGTVTFTPAPGFTGDATITYTVSDPDGQTDEGLAVVAVDPVDPPPPPGGNTAPDAVDDADTTAFNTPITVDLLANDTDAETPALISVISASVPADQGTLVNNGDGTVTFTPVDGFTGEATISYTIDDPEGLTDSAVHNVTVAEAGTRDGIVDGTDGDDLIDTAYTGDPDGDFIDNEDAIIPGQAPNDDIVRAGDGNDTVLAGEGDDSVIGGAGDDSIIGGPGSDTVLGGPGDDFIDTSGPDLAPDLGYPFAPALDPLGFDPDTDPENDRDLVFGGDGNDTIRTGDDRDTIFGGDGDDVIDGGIDDDLIDGGAGNDRIVGGEGNDTIFGGDGDDTIYAGNDPELGLDFLDIPDEATPGFPFSPDRNPDNGRDVVDGGAGNDLIFGADDADLLVGGTGDDTIYGELDNDTIDGGEGNDSLFGGQGDDSIDGGAGNDLLEGGDGDDFLSGGDGDDTMSGGAGNDTMIGGGGQDLFLNVTAGDVIDGGSGPIDFDTLDLRGSAPEGGALKLSIPPMTAKTVSSTISMSTAMMQVSWCSRKSRTSFPVLRPEPRSRPQRASGWSKNCRSGTV